MSDNVALIIAMAERCRDMILAWNKLGLDQPPSLQPRHLERMCSRVIENANTWPLPKAHRWIGFIQGAMIANRMIDLDHAKAMFDKAKNAFGEPNEDLLDHLDPDDPFKLDIGGQG